MLLSESYKIRLKELAGLTSLDEAMDPVSKSNAMKKSSERFTFDRNKMKEAIEQGREIGLSFQSNNSNYKMPVTKYRIVWPVAMGIDKKGNLGEPSVFFDAAELAKQGIRGGYDGMKLDSKGNIWTTGPGGILIISPAGKLLGRIETGNPNSNVNFGEDGSKPSIGQFKKKENNA